MVTSSCITVDASMRDYRDWVGREIVTMSPEILDPHGEQHISETDRQRFARLPGVAPAMTWKGESRLLPPHPDW